MVIPTRTPMKDWVSLTTKTAPDPSYQGAHSAISFAAAEVLRPSFGCRHHSAPEVKGGG